MDTLARTLFVGGLVEKVDKDELYNLFIPFGEVEAVHIPINKALNVHRGFGFVEFALKEDADDAIDNMDGSEHKGRVLVVKFSRAPKGRQPDSRPRGAWAADFIYQNPIEGMTKEDEAALDEALLAISSEAKDNLSTITEGQRKSMPDVPNSRNQALQGPSAL